MKDARKTISSTDINDEKFSYPHLVLGRFSSSLLMLFTVVLAVKTVSVENKRNELFLASGLL